MEDKKELTEETEETVGLHAQLPKTLHKDLRKIALELDISLKKAVNYAVQDFIDKMNKNIEETEAHPELLD